MKKKFTFMELKLLSLLVMLFLLGSSFSLKTDYQNSTTAVKHVSLGIPNVVPNDGWTLDKTIENVECYHKLIDCDGRKAVVLKFNNRNPFNVKITWKEVFDTQAEKAIEGYSGQKKLTLLPGETAQYDCSEGKNPECIIRGAQVSPTYIVEIKQFSFKDIIVSTVGK